MIELSKEEEYAEQIFILHFITNKMNCQLYAYSIFSMFYYTKYLGIRYLNWLIKNKQNINHKTIVYNYNI